MAKLIEKSLFEVALKAENCGEVLRYLAEGVTPSKAQAQQIFELSIKSGIVALLHSAIICEVDVKSSMVDGQPPLFYLCRGYRPNITEKVAHLLIENKADIEAKYRGITLLEFANIMINPPLAKFFADLLTQHEGAEGPDVACAGAGGPSADE